MGAPSRWLAPLINLDTKLFTDSFVPLWPTWSRVSTRGSPRPWRSKALGIEQIRKGTESSCRLGIPIPSNTQPPQESLWSARPRSPSWFRVPINKKSDRPQRRSGRSGRLNPTRVKGSDIGVSTFAGRLGKRLGQGYRSWRRRGISERVGGSNGPSGTAGSGRKSRARLSGLASWFSGPFGTLRVNLWTTIPPGLSLG